MGGGAEEKIRHFFEEKKISKKIEEKKLKKIFEKKIFSKNFFKKILGLSLYWPGRTPLPPKSSHPKTPIYIAERFGLG